MGLTRMLVALAALPVIGCGDLRPWSIPLAPSRPAASEVILADANAEAAAGRDAQAIALYERVAREHTGEDVAAEALHSIAVLRLGSRSVRDRRAALQALNRLATEYPRTRWGREARMWRLLFQQVDRCEAEATRLGADADRLRQTLDSIRDSDLELEGRP